MKSFQTLYPKGVFIEPDIAWNHRQADGEARVAENGVIWSKLLGNAHLDDRRGGIYQICDLSTLGRTDAPRNRRYLGHLRVRSKET